MRAWRAWAYPGVLALYVAWLVFRAWQARTLPFVQVDWVFQGSDQLLTWVVQTIRRGLAGAATCFVLGILTPPAALPWLAGDAGPRRWWLWPACGAFGLATIGLCLAIAWGTRPPVGALLPTLASFLLGVHLSLAAQRGPRPLAWAAGQLAALLLLLGAMAGLALRLAVSEAPLPFDSGELSVTNKWQIAERIRATRPPEDQPWRLQLADREINALMTSALGRNGLGSQAHVTFSPSRFAAQASLALPPRVDLSAFINVRTSGHLAIDAGRLELDLYQLSVGSLEVPSPFLRMLASGLYATLLDDPKARRIVQAIVTLEMQPGAVNLVFQPGALAGQVVPSLAQLLWPTPDVASETRIYLRHLVASSADLPAGADRFGMFLQAAFALALARSADHDPLLENRAALFALAILFGHPDLAPFVGDVLDPDLAIQARAMTGTVALRGRQDWARHFLVSAALVLLSSEASSDRAGLLKEQLDSQAGGSGFSFADKLANFAGNRLALAAIRDEASARALQAQLARGFDVDAFFPPAAGLAEGVSAIDLQVQYGGLDGAGYRQVMDEIHRRLRALPAL
jgi:hypothetical protein